MGMRGVQLEPVDSAELANPRDAIGPERRLAFERVKHDALDEVAEGDLVILGNGFQHLQDVLFDSHAGLDTRDDSGHTACLLCCGATGGSTHGSLLCTI